VTAAASTTMRHAVRAVTVVGVLLATVVASVSLLVPSAYAKNAKFCTTLENAANDVKDLSTSSDKAELQTIANAFKQASKSAPGKVKSAMNTLSDFYGGLSSLSKGDVVKRLAAAGAKYAQAVTTFTKYYSQQCISGSDTTVKGS